MRILKDLPELLQANVITPETADQIRDYYKSKGKSSGNPLLVVFGILGAILIGLGIILIIAHNWDELPRTTKTILAFLPLLVGQGICAYVLIKKQNNIAWRESGPAFLFFAVGASIALVSQIYNIPGGTGTFLLTWMLLCLPLVYVMRSCVTSLLYISGITYYATQLGYWSYSSFNAYLYWFLLVGILPHYYQLFRTKPAGNFIIFHHWLVPLSVIIALGTVANKADELLIIAYLSLFGFFNLIGDSGFFIGQKLKNNGYKALGMLGTIILLLALSFNWFWEDLRRDAFPWRDMLIAPESYASVITTLLASGLLFFHQRNKIINSLQPLTPAFLLFILFFLIGIFSPVVVALINIYILIIGIIIIRKGANQDHLGILNFGLLLITALVICRFFDTDLSFVIRGILFVLVGAGFFVANYGILQKRKIHE